LPKVILNVTEMKRKGTGLRQWKERAWAITNDLLSTWSIWKLLLHSILSY